LGHGLVDCLLLGVWLGEYRVKLASAPDPFALFAQEGVTFELG
jgi:hypothetical protein